MVNSLSKGWRDALVKYGIAITVLQRAKRMLNYVSDADLLNELMNPGHEGWNPLKYPDWVLLEIENNILIRPVQAQIASCMMSPPQSASSVMQLNMGEGKSSVIVPIVAATLATGQMLVRVVVLKPLANQMFHLLVKKLGGLLNRRVYQLPISRKLRPDLAISRLIRTTYEECQRSCGVLLVQPEHILSFDLMGIDQLLLGNTDVGNDLIKTQRWLNSFSRDILDESDEILSVRFELIYTMGTQTDLEFSPERWQIIQHMLEIFNKFAKELVDKFPDGLEVIPVCPDAVGLYRIRVLQEQAGNELLRLISEAICEDGIPGLAAWTLSAEERALLKRFLTDISMPEDDAQPLYRRLLAAQSAKDRLLLLRGLLAGGVLIFVLAHKRWRVNYGLALDRSLLAVPYRAKDTPASRAEFSHPDATIVLTCLSYYYGGLSDKELVTAFEQLEKSDNPDEEYECWVKTAPNLPQSLRQFKGVNLKDGKACSERLFPALRFSKATIDFYLSQMVFPREMKEFPRKLSSSGWNIAQEKTHPTTGFSGTNDSKYILPLSISQCELEEQLYTNAMQLNCLLHPDNSVQRLNKGDEVLDAKTLLSLVVTSERLIRVIIDAGAQVLELRNDELARRWLDMVPDPSVRAAVYFDDRNELFVLSRDGFREPLALSPLANQMDQCLVYLDEAHTRGTDLVLPMDYRAAVTLGPSLTKDRLVQGKLSSLSLLRIFANEIR
jgi:hypothetical protein